MPTFEDQQEPTACGLPAPNFVDNSRSKTTAIVAVGVLAICVLAIDIVAMGVVTISIVAIGVIDIAIVAVGVVWVDIWPAVTMAVVVNTIIVVGTIVVVWCTTRQIATLLQVGNIQVILVLWWSSLGLLI